MRFNPAAALVLLLTSCTLSPLSRKINVGEEPMVVFVATGNSGWTDLFAVRPGGGEVVQLTFTRLVESMPRLTSHGDVIAFVRDRGEQPGEDLVVMNLLNGAERVLELPPESGSIEAIGWTWGDAAVQVRTARGHFRVTAPPAELAVSLLDSVGALAADSTIDVLLGTPRFARAFECEGGGVCIAGRGDSVMVISSAGRAPFRWGSDSVAWLEGDEIVVRSLGPGAARRVEIERNASGLKAAAYAEP